MENNRKCVIEGCNNKHYAKDYCQKHYKKFTRYGDPLISVYESHGMLKSPEYKAWNHIIQRCTNPKNKSYKDYGGRGILVCGRWRDSFSAFLEDMGKKPFSKAQIDREENNGNYEPSNCRWVSPSKNNQNKRTTVLNWFTVNSIRRVYALKRFTSLELSKIYNLNKWTLENVIYNKNWKQPAPEADYER